MMAVIMVGAPAKKVQRSRRITCKAFKGSKASKGWSEHRADGCQAIVLTHTCHEEQGSTQDGIDRDQDQASFGSSHLQERPFWQVGCPNGNVVSFVEAQSHQPFGDGVGSLTVVLVGP